jgi:hypothetical protein
MVIVRHALYLSGLESILTKEESIFQKLTELFLTNSCFVRQNRHPDRTTNTTSPISLNFQKRIKHIVFKAIFAEL